MSEGSSWDSTPEERHLRALSFWVGDGYRAELEYAVEDTPCDVVVRQRTHIAIAA
jgi:hypothetical protein